MEKSWKDILREGEEAYDPQAWENVSRRLDQSMPVKGKGFSPKNFLLGGSAAVIIGAGLYFFIGNEEKTTAQNTEQKTEQLSQNQASDQVNAEKDLTTENGKAGRSSGSGSGANSGSSASSGSSGVDPDKKPDKKGKADQNQGTNTKEYKEYNDPELIVNDPVLPLNNSTRFNLPKHASEYCINEEAEFSNPNENSCILTDESGNVIASILGNSKTKVQLSKKGNYYFRYPKFDVKGVEISEQEKAFTVNGPQTPDFSYENEISYDNGIPYISLKAEDFQNGMSWHSDKGEIANQSENSKITVFRKGDYRITLEKKDQQGCVAKKSQVISIREDYNLLAPNAIRPSSNDPRNSRFMPVALTVRNTGFELIIIDPETGRTVFKSTSADNAWDGTDMNSEQSDKANKAYIWKVKLQQPERGEKSEYTGTVMKLVQ